MHSHLEYPWSQQGQVYSCHASPLALVTNGGVFTISDSTLPVTLTGNGNTFHLIHSRVEFNITGNGNTLLLKDTQLRVGITGNGNDIRINGSNDGGMVRVLYKNGYANTLPQGSIEQGNMPTNFHDLNLLNNNPLMGRGAIKNNQSNNIFQDQGSQSRARNINMNPYVSSGQRSLKMNTALNRDNGGISSSNNPFKKNSHNHFRNNELDANRNRPMDHRNNPFRQEDYIPSSMGSGNHSVQISEEGLQEEDINRLPKSIYNGEPRECSICWQSISRGQEVTYLFCFHSYHSNCCLAWLRKAVTCPMCQIDVKERLQNIESDS